MINPIKIHRDLLNNYISYFNTSIPLRSKYYEERRKELFENENYLMQEPYIELIRKYSGAHTIQEILPDNDIADFLSKTLLKTDGEPRKLYAHQETALKEVYENKKNIVVTTGTGSGKTECFFLPMIANLLEESRNWPVKGRDRAMRTMILYPLNALAEDQMVRLRKTLETPEAKKWLDDNRNGNRFYFGRYTGLIPKNGTEDKTETIWDALKLEEQETEKGKLTEEEKESLRNNIKKLKFFTPNRDSGAAEQSNREQMKKECPDILITNYSMLNVMLMRSEEVDTIFKQTKEWLAKDSENVFTLIIDELHSYRGTAGTEIAYIIHNLLDRLGIADKPEQVRFIASSASMDADAEETWKFLSDFFFTDARETFAPIIHDKKEDFSSVDLTLSEEAKSVLSKIGKLCIKDYGQNYQSEIRKAITNALDINSFVESNTLVEKLKKILQNGAQSIKYIAEQLSIDLEQTEALLTIINLYDDGNNNAKQPLRAHYFARNIDTVYFCSNPNCSELSEDARKDPNTTWGQLYLSPQVRCKCGSKIYEGLVCRSCGEVFLTGYKGEYTNTNQVEYYLENEPLSASDRREVYYNQKKGEIAHDDWSSKCNIDGGKVADDSDGAFSRYKYAVNPQNNFYPDFPMSCPQCGLEYKYRGDRQVYYALSKHITGVQKVNQLFADKFYELLDDEENETAPKLVLFSDSRQAAAKLSAGVELDHYKDTLRSVIIENIVKQESREKALLKKYYDAGADKSKLTPEEQEEIKNVNRAYRNLIRDKFEDCLNEDDEKKLNEYFNSFNFTELQNTVLRSMVKLHINPCGPQPLKQTFGVDSNNDPIKWYKYFDKNANWVSFTGDMSGKDTEKERIERETRTEMKKVMLQGHKTSFESLGLGYFVPINHSSDTLVTDDMAKSAVHIMGELGRFDQTTSFPKKLTKYLELKDGFRYTGNRTRIGNVLNSMKVVKGLDDYSLNLEGITFIPSKPEDNCWKCKKCGTVHLQKYLGFCTFCYDPLPEAIKVKDLPENILTKKIGKQNHRLHCEELTGQTDKSETFKRQRLFMDLTLGEKENKNFDTIDLLSVTTTMEAGVDIGDLSAVMMGNFPPQRFNYQQRVGRAGRRGKPLALSLTVARNNSHDQTHYNTPSLIVSGNPANPFIDRRSLPIVKRFIVKEVLYEAFKANNVTGEENTHNHDVHGEFGKTFEWMNNDKNNCEKVRQWISTNSKRISEIIEMYAKDSYFNDLEKQELSNYINNNLVTEITEITKDETIKKESLAETLSCGGLMPMFGFPTQVRNLYEEKPEDRRSLIEFKGTSRSCELALNTFAPGCQIVKDKKLFKSIGFVKYEANRFEDAVVSMPGLKFLDGSFLCTCKTCGATVMSTDDIENCSICDSIDISKSNKVAIPLGYRAANDGDFNGQFEYVPQSTETYLEVDTFVKNNEFSPIEGLNIRMAGNKDNKCGIVNTVNTNNGKFYNLIRRNLGNDDWIYGVTDNIPPVNGYEKVALMTSKTTGVLVFELSEFNNNLNITPLIHNDEYNPEQGKLIKGAFLSLATLLRNSICAYLDIDTKELEIGYALRKLDDRYIPMFYFSETLQNGAGYTNAIKALSESNPTLFKEKIINPLLEGGSIYKNLTEETHMDNCDSSCYKCLRDYYNQSNHKILNWRLGLDLVNMMVNKDCLPSIFSEYWNNISDKAKFIMKNNSTGKKVYSEAEITGNDSLKLTETKGEKSTDYYLKHPFLERKTSNEVSILQVLEKARVR